jgi:ketosteroid isomerase-like protein
MSLLLAVTLPAALVVPAVAEDAAPAAAVEGFVRSYLDAFNRGDGDALAAMVSARSNVASVSRGTITRGRAAIVAGIEKTVGADVRFTITADSLDVTPLGPSAALVFAPCTMVMPSVDGEIRLRGAFTLVVDQSGGGWHILHEHWSTQPARK